MLKLSRVDAFLLFEVLVSTLILSIGLISVIYAFSYSQKAAQKTAKYFETVNSKEENAIISGLDIDDEKKWLYLN